MLSIFKRNSAPVIRERATHCISRANIDPDALKVLYRLSRDGHAAYLVGGSVRDLLLGRQPKDFDVGTDARPNEIRRLFRNCFLIGRRFRLAHIVFGRKVIETSTFRRQPDEVPNENGHYQTEDNTFGTPEEDAKRRDFTVNGLFYDIKTFSVIDYVGGLKDLDKRMLRCIGDPNLRFREDPVRMMRAVKFASRLGFTIDRASLRAIKKHHAEIGNASVPRVCEEVFRLFGFGAARDAFTMLWKLGMLRDLLPDLNDYIEASGGRSSPLWACLAALDRAPGSDELSNGVRVACLYYPAFAARLKAEEARTPGKFINRQLTARAVLESDAMRLHIPKAATYTAVGLFDAPRRFAVPPQKGRSTRFLSHPAFTEALALQRILVEAGLCERGALDAWEVLHAQQGAARRARTARTRTASDANKAPDSDSSDTIRRRPRRRPRRKPAPQPASQPS